MAMTQWSRTLILGLDGATLDLIRPWAEAGLLPTFQKLMREGAWGRLRSTIPPITPAAWSSFITGMNPGKHGLYDFTGHRKDSYDVYMVRASHRQAPSLWQILSAAGRRVAVCNVPVTYPPEQVNGVMVSGLMTPPGATDASYPPDLQVELQRVVPEFSFYNYETYRPGKEVEFIQDVLKVNQATFDAAQYLMRRQPWDFFMVVFMGTDRMGHFMWKHMENQGATAPKSVRDAVANAMQDCYRDLDAKLGKLIEGAGENAHVIVMSDHGHGRMEGYFEVNTWLLEKGYIQLKRAPIVQFKLLLFRLGLTHLNIFQFLKNLGFVNPVRRATRQRPGVFKKVMKNAFLSFRDIDWSRTRAYSNGMYGPIFVNLKGREPQGIVAPGAEYDALLDQITGELRDVKDPKTGMPFVGEIHRGRETYKGSQMRQAPDLIFFARDWRYLGEGHVQFQTNRWMSRSVDRSGQHRPDGILFLAGPGVRRGVELTDSSITDIAPTVLALMGVPIPEAMDGRVLEAALLPELQQELVPQFHRGDVLGPDWATVPDLSEEDEEKLITRLRDLGYIG